MIYYLSFSDDYGFRGGAFVEAADGEAALWAATKQNLNLGGEVAIVEVPLKCVERCKNLMGRTITRDDMTAIFGEIASPHEVESKATIVCQHHNPVKGGRA